MKKSDISKVIDRLLNMGYLHEQAGAGSALGVTSLGIEYTYKLAGTLVDKLAHAGELQVKDAAERDSAVRALLIGYIKRFENGGGPAVLAHMYMELEGERPGSA